MTTRLKTQACLACGHTMELHSGIVKAGEGDPRPTPGDACICIQCGLVMVYDNALRFRRPAANELAWLEGDERVQLAVEGIGRLHRMRRH